MTCFNQPRATVLAACGLLAALLAASCSKAPDSAATRGANEVVLFASLDAVFSEPIIAAFEKETGIKVNFVPDAEAAKTVGLVNRLLARKEHPEADVFWNNEVANTIVLQQAGVLEPYAPPSGADVPAAYRSPQGWWTGFAARARVILINTDLLKEADAPKSLEALTDPRFKGRVVMARPLSGTTLTHVAALCAKWGVPKTRQWLEALKANDVKLAQGNAMARNLVQDGEFPICLTDTDDANGAFLKNKPVQMIYPDQEGADALGALLIPNTVCLIRGGPNAENGRKLLDFITSKRTEEALSKAECAQMPLRPGIAPYSARFDPTKLKLMEVNWLEAANHFETVRTMVKELGW